MEGLHPISVSPTFFLPQIFAGGDVSMARVSKQPNTALDFLLTVPYTQPTCILEEKVNDMISIGEDDMIDDELFTLVFSQHSALFTECMPHYSSKGIAVQSFQGTLL